MRSSRSHTTSGAPKTFPQSPRHVATHARKFPALHLPPRISSQRTGSNTRSARPDSSPVKLNLTWRTFPYSTHCTQGLAPDVRSGTSLTDMNLWACNCREPPICPTVKTPRQTGWTVAARHRPTALVRRKDQPVSGHRFYGPKSVDRLYRVSMLRAFGLPLECVFTVVTLIRNFPRMSNW